MREGGKGKSSLWVGGVNGLADAWAVKIRLMGRVGDRRDYMSVRESLLRNGVWRGETSDR